MVDELDNGTLLEELTANKIDRRDNPKRYIYPKDLAEKFDLSKPAISQRLDSLKDEGYIEMDLPKTKHARSYFFGNRSVYVPTAKATEKYGGLGTKLRQITGGPSNRTTLDLHGDLLFRMKVKDMPENDTFDWDNTNQLNNGVEHRYKAVEGPNGQKCTIELTKGRETATITVKPSVSASDNPTELMKQADNLAWYFHRYLSKAGYELSAPERKGEGKFSVVSKSDEFEDVPDQGPNHIKDKSPKEDTVHFRTGDMETNAEASKMITEVGHMAEVKKEIKENVDQLENIEEIKEQIQKQRKAMRFQSQNVTAMAENMNNLAQNVEKLSDTLMQVMEHLGLLDDSENDKPKDRPVPDGLYG